MRQAPVVAALGVTQIIGYGSIYYAYPILAPAIAAEFGAQEPVLFGILSAGLLLGGLASPVLGRQIDRFGGAQVMCAGSLAMALLSLLIAGSPNIYVFGGLTLLIELLSFAVLYDAAFSVLAQKRPNDTRRAITNLTLIAGFASTLFWPLSGWLVGEVGWQGAYLVFAALHLLLAAPLHGWIFATPHVNEKTSLEEQRPKPDERYVPLEGRTARRAFILLGIAFGLTGMAISALGVHLVLALQSLGLGSSAYLIAMLMGPAQVAIRVVDATLWRNQHPLLVAIVSSAAIPAALALLLLPGPAMILAVCFAISFGAGQGLSSIVRGAVPVALFGTAGMGQRLGRLAAIRSMLGAAAPFLFSWIATALSIQLAIGFALLVAITGLVALMSLRLELRIRVN
ncbi:MULTISPECIES: MFS transporter [Haematobacter]|uniref:MFS transporter n=1 Tax=Haematobacter genomosp. 1 TaxID=366618 RepID=A0A212A6S6_9RHOB|nr:MULTISPECIES: MFS transporter [Haematobacter]OWJ69564.1 MFS transporter [Haematobacter massiliensis]OWJ74984.1 MFS transporter [Haematobacter genomosp. 1]OWJ85735.1 MFS transporter [Haematobacter massiliensis]